ncbi:MAG: restriction endonuclease subunit S, partial [Acidobacteria bacterium]|nr:restriction endonuclease subunit S [Acidobacteriota bacterium]
MSSGDLEARGWSLMPVSEAAEINPIIPLATHVSDESLVPLYDMAAIDESCGILRAPALVPAKTCRNGKTRFQKGDVLFAKITPCVQNGKSAFVTNIAEELGFGSSEFYVLRPKKSLLPEYLFYFVRQKSVVQAAVDSFSGTSGRQRVPNSFWDKLTIPLPPLPVQKRVVQILQKAEEIRRKCKEALDLADAILPAIFHEMFGDPTSNPKGYERTTIGKVTSLVTSGYTPRGGAQNYVEEGPLLIRSQNVRMLHLDLNCAHIPEAIYEEMARVRVMPGDVLLNITGASIGRVAWAADDIPPASVNQHVCIIRAKRGFVAPEYLAFCLATPWYQHIILNAPGSAQTGFNHARVRTLEILVPPMSVQKAFVMQVQALRETRDKYLAAIEGVEKGFQGLLARAFTGELTAEWEAANADEIAVRTVLHERLPRLLLLALLAEKARRARQKAPEVLVTALMKYAFLLQMEGNGRQKLYHFVPYHYGPFAKEIYTDLQKLREEGL